VLGRGQARSGKDAPEGPALLGEVNRFGRRPHHRHPGVGQVLGQAQRRLATELHDHARQRTRQSFGVDDLEDVLQRQRLEVQPVGGVVVGRDGFRVAVDHDRLVSGVVQRHRGMDARVVELDALADPVGSAAQDDDCRTPPLCYFGFLVVRRVVVGRARGELGRTGVDGLVDRTHPERVAKSPYDLLGRPP
jgi:hypothetical protein